MTKPQKRKCPQCGLLFWPRASLANCPGCGAETSLKRIEPRDWTKPGDFVTLVAQVRREGEPGKPAEVLRELSPCCDLTSDLTARMHALIRDIQSHLKDKGQL